MDFCSREKPKDQGVSFTNILQAAFFVRKCFCAAFMCLQFGFVIFWQKKIGTKAARKMLLNLTIEHFAKSKRSR